MQAEAKSQLQQAVRVLGADAIQALIRDCADPSLKQVSYTPSRQTLWCTMLQLTATAISNSIVRCTEPTID